MAAVVGATAALSWTLSVWIALGGDPPGRDRAEGCDGGRAGPCVAELGSDAERD